MFGVIRGHLDSMPVLSGTKSRLAAKAALLQSHLGRRWLWVATEGV